MITTFNELVKSLELKVGQMAEVNVWIGTSWIRHANRVMLIDENRIYIEYDKSICVEKDPVILKCKGEGFLLCEMNNKYAKAYSLAEVLADANLLYSIKLEKEEEKKAKCFEYVKTCVEGINEALRDTYSSEKRAMANKLDNFSNLCEFKYFLNSAGYYKNDNYLDKDSIYCLKNIFRSHSFVFADEDNEGINTFVDLNCAVTIETNCQYGHKDCVHITMVNGTTYNIYKKGNEDLYVALETLYGD